MAKTLLFKRWAWFIMLCLATGCAGRPRDDSRHLASNEMPTDAAPSQGICRQAHFEPALPMDLEPRSYIAGVRDHYNRVYAEPHSESLPANDFLLHSLEVIEAMRQHDAQISPPSTQHVAESSPTRTALDIAMGDGRNTIALARHGYRTTGFDIADVGVNRARKRAAELGLTIEANVSYFENRYLQPNQWDVVAMMYFDVNANTMRRLKDAIKPGGYLIIEFSTIFPDAPRHEGDRELNWTLHRYDGWEIIHYEYAIGPVQWKQRHLVENVEGPRIRVLARKPAVR